MQYVDTDFPAVADSLSEEDGEMKHLRDIVKVWLRPSQVTSWTEEDNQLEWTMFNNPVCDDVVQGYSDDCW